MPWDKDSILTKQKEVFMAAANAALLLEKKKEYLWLSNYQQIKKKIL